MAGRPVKPVSCVRCGESRPSTLIRSPSGRQGLPGICFVCVPPRKKLKLTSEEWAATAKQMMERSLADSTQGLPRMTRRSEPIGNVSATENLDRAFAEYEAMRSLTTFLTFNALSTPHCICCRSVGAPDNPVAADGNGNFWCQLCSRSVFVCGRCVVHGSVVFFPALADNPAPTNLLPELRDTGEIVVDQGDDL